MGILDSLFNLLPTAANFISQGLTNQQNLKLQKEEWAREDSSVQRKVEDLKRAGLNPVLATGGGAPTSLAVKMQAPQADPDIYSKSLAAQGIRSQIQRTAAETAIAQAQERAITAKSDYEQMYYQNLASKADIMSQLDWFTKDLNWRILQKQSEITDNDVLISRSRAMQEASIAEQEMYKENVMKHDWELQKNNTLPISTSGIMGQVGNVTGAMGTKLGSIIDSVVNTIKAKQGNSHYSK